VRSTARRGASCATALLLAACSAASIAPGEGAADPPTPGFYSAAQRARGETAFAASCAECHALSELQGPDFEVRWRRQTAWHLFREVSATMPEDRPGRLATATYADIIAFILSLNGYQQGSLDLPPEREALEAIPLGAGARRTKSESR